MEKEKNFYQVTLTDIGSGNNIAAALDISEDKQEIIDLDITRVIKKAFFNDPGVVSIKWNEALNEVTKHCDSVNEVAYASWQLHGVFYEMREVLEKDPAAALSLFLKMLRS